MILIAWIISIMIPIPDMVIAQAFVSLMEGVFTLLGEILNWISGGR